MEHGSCTLHRLLDRKLKELCILCTFKQFRNSQFLWRSTDRQKKGELIKQGLEQMKRNKGDSPKLIMTKMVVLVIAAVVVVMVVVVVVVIVVVVVNAVNVIKMRIRNTKLNNIIQEISYDGT